MDTRYRVIGPKRIAGKAKGQIVDRDLTEGQARALILGGHIEAVTEPRSQPRKTRTARTAAGGTDDDKEL